jgi:hypothetical protein
MTTEEKTVVGFAPFHETGILEHFFLSAHNDADARALRFMHAVMGDELKTANTNRAHKNQVANEIAIEKVEFRYDLFKTYVESFFPFDYKPDVEALIIATICDEYVSYAAPPEEGPDFPPSPLHNFLDHETVYRAMALWEKACGIEGNGIPTDEPVAYESIFLAHINALENLRELEEMMGEYSPEDLGHIMNKDLAPIAYFVDTRTEIGKVLQEFRDHVAGIITEITRAAAPAVPAAPPPSAPQRGHLRLAVSNDPTP